MDMKLFKEFTEPVDGASVIPTTGDEPGSMYIKDVVYAKYGDVERVLQILVPTSRNKKVMPPEMRAMFGAPAPDFKYPCIVYVQGSAWAPQNIYGAVPDLAKYCEMGYVVALVQYRDFTVASFPAPVIDARNAVRFMKVHAADYAVDPERIILAGNSSGGHTAVYAGIYHDDDEDTNLYPGVSGEAKGIINFYGSTDFTFPESNPTTDNHNCADSPEGKEMGGVDLNEHPELIEKLTVACNIHEDTVIAPTLIFHGTLDRIVNTRCSVNLYNRMKAMGKDVQLYLIGGADHGGSEFFMPEILRLVDMFAKKCFEK